MRTTLFPLALGLSLLAGCSSDDHDSSRTRSSRDDSYRSTDAARQAGDRNTRTADLEDDGRLNGSARSYEERKASRAADRGDLDAARREEELRRERELGR
jgi:hypothetical protein